jgi:hypothetical protein
MFSFFVFALVLASAMISAPVLEFTSTNAPILAMVLACTVFPCNNDNQTKLLRYVSGLLNLFTDIEAVFAMAVAFDSIWVLFIAFFSYLCINLLSGVYQHTALMFKLGFRLALLWCGVNTASLLVGNVASIFATFLMYELLAFASLLAVLFGVAWLIAIPFPNNNNVLYAIVTLYTMVMIHSLTDSLIETLSLFCMVLLPTKPVFNMVSNIKNWFFALNDTDHTDTKGTDTKGTDTIADQTETKARRHLEKILNNGKNAIFTNKAEKVFTELLGNLGVSGVDGANDKCYTQALFAVLGQLNIDFFENMGSLLSDRFNEIEISDESLKSNLVEPLVSAYSAAYSKATNKSLWNSRLLKVFVHKLELPNKFQIVFGYDISHTEEACCRGTTFTLERLNDEFSCINVVSNLKSGFDSTQTIVRANTILNEADKHSSLTVERARMLVNYLLNGASNLLMFCKEKLSADEIKQLNNEANVYMSIQLEHKWDGLLIRLTKVRDMVYVRLQNGGIIVQVVHNDDIDNLAKTIANKFVNSIPKHGFIMYRDDYQKTKAVTQVTDAFKASLQYLKNNSSKREETFELYSLDSPQAAASKLPYGFLVPHFAETRNLMEKSLTDLDVAINLRCNIPELKTTADNGLYTLVTNGASNLFHVITILHYVMVSLDSGMNKATLYRILNDSGKGGIADWLEKTNNSQSIVIALHETLMQYAANGAVTEGFIEKLRGLKNDSWYQRQKLKSFFWMELERLLKGTGTILTNSKQVIEVCNLMKEFSSGFGFEMLNPIIELLGSDIFEAMKMVSNDSKQVTQFLVSLMTKVVEFKRKILVNGINTVVSKEFINEYYSGVFSSDGDSTLTLPVDELNKLDKDSAAMIWTTIRFLLEQGNKVTITTGNDQLHTYSNYQKWINQYPKLFRVVCVRNLLLGPKDNRLGASIQTSIAKMLFRQEWLCHFDDSKLVQRIEKWLIDEEKKTITINHTIASKVWNINPNERGNWAPILGWIHFKFLQQGYLDIFNKFHILIHPVINKIIELEMPKVYKDRTDGKWIQIVEQIIDSYENDKNVLLEITGVDGGSGGQGIGKSVLAEHLYMVLTSNEYASNLLPKDIYERLVKINSKMIVSKEPGDKINRTGIQSYQNSSMVDAIFQTLNHQINKGKGEGEGEGEDKRIVVIHEFVSSTSKRTSTDNVTVLRIALEQKLDFSTYLKVFSKTRKSEREDLKQGEGYFPEQGEEHRDPRTVAYAIGDMGIEMCVGNKNVTESQKFGFAQALEKQGLYLAYFVLDPLLRTLLMDKLGDTDPDGMYHFGSAGYLPGDFLYQAVQMRPPNKEILVNKNVVIIDKENNILWKGLYSECTKLHITSTSIPRCYSGLGALINDPETLALCGLTCEFTDLSSPFEVDGVWCAKMMGKGNTIPLLNILYDGKNTININPIGDIATGKELLARIMASLKKDDKKSHNYQDDIDEVNKTPLDKEIRHKKGIKSFIQKMVEDVFSLSKDLDKKLSEYDKEGKTKVLKAIKTRLSSDEAQTQLLNLFKNQSSAALEQLHSFFDKNSILQSEINRLICIRKGGEDVRNIRKKKEK